MQHQDITEGLLKQLREQAAERARDVDRGVSTSGEAARDLYHYGLGVSESVRTLFGTREVETAILDETHRLAASLDPTWSAGTPTAGSSPVVVQSGWFRVVGIFLLLVAVAIVVVWALALLVVSVTANPAEELDSFPSGMDIFMRAFASVPPWHIVILASVLSVPYLVGLIMGDVGANLRRTRRHPPLP